MSEPMVVTQDNLEVAVRFNIDLAVRRLRAKVLQASPAPLAEIDAAGNNINLVATSDEDKAALTYEKWFELRQEASNV
jgi:hypothetical protein